MYDELISFIVFARSTFLNRHTCKFLSARFSNFLYIKCEIESTDALVGEEDWYENLLFPIFMRLVLRFSWVFAMKCISQMMNKKSHNLLSLLQVSFYPKNYFRIKDGVDEGHTRISNEGGSGSFIPLIAFILKTYFCHSTAQTVGTCRFL